jgi:osmotically inducible protein OsmC
MFLSALLSGKGLTPESIETSATVTLEKDEIGPRIKSIELTSRAKVPGISAEDFAAVAAEAKDKCPISRLYAKGTEISLDAQLG